MSHCIAELHLQQAPCVVQHVVGGWRVVCDCGKQTVVYVLISGALAEQSLHTVSHTFRAA